MKRALLALFCALVLSLSTDSLAQDITVRDEGAIAGRAREINCVGGGLTCSVSGGIAAFSFGSFAASETLSFATTFNPITITGGDSGAGDPALIIDNLTDEYLIVRFPHFAQFNFDDGGGVLGSFYVDGPFSAFAGVGNHVQLEPEVHIDSILRIVGAGETALLKIQPDTITTPPAGTQRELFVEYSSAATGGATSDNYVGITSTHTFGLGGVAQKGISLGLESNVIIAGSGDADNQFAYLFGAVRADIGTGYTQTTGPAGQLWGADLGVHGPIAVQPVLLNGIVQVVNNHYNGSPSLGPSAAQWLVTKPGQGAGIDATHIAATTYPLDVGLGIVGESTSSGVGFTTALQIGGSGGAGWLVSSSKIGTGINTRDYTTRGIYLNNPSGSPTAGIELTSTAGGVILGDLTASQCVATNGSKKLVSGCTVTVYRDLDLVGVSGGVAGHVWNDDPLSTACTPTAVTGTNRATGVCRFPDSDGDYGRQISIQPPVGWAGTLDADVWYKTTGSGNARFQFQTKCYADDEADDASFNSASVVTAAAGTSGRPNKITITGITATGCAADELLRIRFFRNRTEGSDTLNAEVDVEKVVFKLGVTH